MMDFVQLPYSPPLTEEEETYLFGQLSKAHRVIGKLAKNRILTNEESSQLDTAKHIEKDCVDRICRANTALVVRLAGRFASDAVTRDELLSDGFVKLLDCIRLFDTSRGTRFSTYLWRALVSAFHRSSSKAAANSQHLADWQAELSPSDAVGDSATSDKADQLIELREVLGGNKAGLTMSERCVVLFSLSLGQSRREVTLMTGFSEKRQRKLERSAIKKLRKAMGG
jgi:RNA polymerase sigma factor (sigma-70 family)